jgi:heme exporter protein A
MDLVVDGLACARGGVPVLENVEFRVSAGGALILRGPNGSGKTTLLRTLSGLQRASAGSVSLRPEAVSYAGHADAVKLTLTVAENLTFWAAIHGRGGIKSALKDFDLEGLSNRSALQLSAGQRRRLGLARLIVAGRPVWMLDEPTVSLDAESVGRFGKILARHLDAGGIAVTATHTDLGVEADEVDVRRFAAELSVDDFDAAFA